VGKWVKSNKSIFSIELDNSIEYYIPVGQETKITNFDIEVMNKFKWYSFDQYRKKAFNIWWVALPIHKLKWSDGFCNCSALFKKFMCKHVVGIAIGLNYCKLPPMLLKVLELVKKDVVVDQQKSKKHYSFNDYLLLINVLFY